MQIYDKVQAESQVTSDPQGREGKGQWLGFPGGPLLHLEPLGQVDVSGLVTVW